MPDAIACPGCLKRFAWTPKVAGKRVTCHCGQKFITPETPDGDVIPIYETKAADDSASRQRKIETYDLSDDASDPPSSDAEPKSRSAKHANTTKCPDCNAPVKPQAVVCVRCGFDLSAGQKLQTQVAQASSPSGEPGDDYPADIDDELARRAALAHEPAIPVRSKLEQAVANDVAKSQRFREIVLPTAVLILGLSLWLFNTLLMAPWNADAALFAFGGRADWSGNVWAATKTHAWMIALIGFLTFVGRWMCTALLGADFGTPLVALLKMSAFTFGFVGLASVAYYGLNIMVEGVFFIVLLLWGSAAIASFFIVAYSVWDDLDQSEVGLLLAVVGVGFLVIDSLLLPIAFSVLGFA